MSNVNLFILISLGILTKNNVVAQLGSFMFNNFNWGNSNGGPDTGEWPIVPHEGDGRAVGGNRRPGTNGGSNFVIVPHGGNSGGSGLPSPGNFGFNFGNRGGSSGSGGGAFGGTWGRRPQPQTRAPVPVFTRAPVPAVTRPRPPPRTNAQTPPPVGPAANGPSFGDNVMDCCKANGVSSKCIGLCETPPNPKAFCSGKANCESTLKVAQYCGLNAGEVNQCCKDKGIPSECRFFCDSKSFPSVDDLVDLRDCLDHQNPGLSCAYENYSNKKEWTTKSWDSEKWSSLVKGVVKDQLNC